MRLLRPELVLCVVCWAGCARPTLEEEGDGGDVAVDRDAEVVGSTRDAAVPVTDTGVSSNATNPIVDASPASTSPADAAAVIGSGDAGDVLPPTLYNCQAEPPISGVSIGTGRVTSLTIDGQSSTLANVQPGAQVNIAVQVMLGTCGTIGVPAMYLGVEGAAEQCQHGGVCTAVTLPSLFEFTVTAPQKEGLYSVFAALSSSFSACTGTTSTPPDTKIAALCVGKAR